MQDILTAARRWLLLITLAAALGATSALHAATPAPQQQIDRGRAYTYRTVASANGLLAFQAPTAWDDIRQDEWLADGELAGLRMTVASDVATFDAAWGAPGLVASYSDVLPARLSLDETVDLFARTTACTPGERSSGTEGDFLTVTQVWENCGDAGTRLIVTGLTPASGASYYVVMEAYIASAIDEEAAARALSALAVSRRLVDAAALPALDSLVAVDGLANTYAEVRDPAIVALFPASFQDQQPALWRNANGTPIGLQLTLAPNIARFQDSWSAPGFVVRSGQGYTATVDVDAALADSAIAAACIFDQRATTSHTLAGQTWAITYDVYHDCGASTNTYVLGIAQSEPPGSVITFDAQIVDEFDAEAFDVFLRSFYLPATAPARDLFSPPTATPTSTPTSTPTATATATATPTLPLTATAAATATLAAVPTNTPRPTDTATPRPSPTNTQRPTHTATPLPSPTNTPRPTNTATPPPSPTNTPRPTHTATPPPSPTNTPRPTHTATPLPAPTNTPAPTATATRALPSPTPNVLPTVPPAATPEPFAGISAVVLVDRLNVRSAPMVDAERVAVVTANTVLTVLAQTGECTWYQIAAAGDVAGWVASGAAFDEQYLQLDGVCADLPPVPAAAP